MTLTLPPQLSIATTLYMSESYVREFYYRCCSVVEELKLDAEFLFIDDGSPDQSVLEVRELAQRDERVRLKRFTRNFGHTAARLAAMQEARGDLVFLLDVDLEERPEWLVDFYALMSESGADSVYGVQKRRKGGWFERLSGSLFYWVVQRAGRLNVPKNPVTARLMTRRYVQAISKFQERDVFLAEIWNDVGYLQVPVVVEKLGTSPSTYTFRAKFEQFITALTSFSIAPLYLVAALGLSSSILGFGALTVAVFRWLLGSPTLSGWLSIIASIWMFGGMLLCSLGLIGIYLSRVFVEVKARPRFLVREERK